AAQRGQAIRYAFGVPVARLALRRAHGPVRLSRPRRQRGHLSRDDRRRRDPRGGVVTLKHAVACIERGVARAQGGGFLVAIAVVDEGGPRVACHRMDGALWITPEIARAKANAAAAFRTTTLDMEERFSKGSRQLFAGNVASLGDYHLVFGQGGGAMRG